jgi:hypothetical protein
VAVTFGIIEQADAREAYQWHRGFSSNYEYIFPRPWKSYESLILERQAWCARDDNGDYLGSAYFAFDEDKNEWEIGGVMVAKAEKGMGTAGVLARLTLGHVLISETPIKRGHRIIAHIHAENQEPRALFTKALRFSMPEKPEEFPGQSLTGLKKNKNGNVEGFVLSIAVPATLSAIADWCDSWKGKLHDDRDVRIRLPEGMTLAKWSTALRSMVAPTSGRPILRRIR